MDFNVDRFGVNVGIIAYENGDGAYICMREEFEDCSYSFCSTELTRDEMQQIVDLFTKRLEQENDLLY
jgi:hypothetical protein